MAAQRSIEEGRSIGLIRSITQKGFAPVRIKPAVKKKIK
jgi:hypothetical protein